MLEEMLSGHAFDSTQYRKELSNHVKRLIHNTNLLDSGYIWIDEVINYNGGDNFAKRFAHPNLINTEGDSLSTNMKDLKGNLPYKEELEGVLKNGEVFFRYWFKERNTNQVSEKLAYAKLYKKYNWIIGSGVYLNDIEPLIDAETEKNTTILNTQSTYAILIGCFAVFLALLSILFFRKKIEKILSGYALKVDERERSLEDLIDQKSQQLSENEQKYLSIYRNNQSIMMLIDPDTGRIVDANNSALKFYGYSLDQITSLKISDINTLSNEEVKRAINATTSSANRYFLFKHQLSNKEVRDVEVYTEHMELNGKTHLFSIIHDISELRRTQQELIRAKEKAEESDKLKSAFLANMSHEIRTPMNSILGFTDLLNNENNSKEQNEKFHDIIQNSGEQLLRIIDDIIDFSHIESNQLQITKTEISVNETMNYIFDSFKDVKEKYEGKIQFKLNIPSRDLIVSTDEIRLCQICNNLLHNAFKNTKEGYIEFGYRLINTSNTDYIQFFVKDTGCGIAEDKFDLIFDRFAQTPNSTYREGNGLGLSITKGLVKLLGGCISLESTVDVGSTFFFTIPASKNSDKSAESVQVWN
jgi:PAS domain S-box-containing protein